MWVIGVLIGIGLSFALALFITGLILKWSNDFGDNTGSYKHFAEGSIQYSIKQNGVRP